MKNMNNTLLKVVFGLFCMCILIGVPITSYASDGDDVNKDPLEGRATGIIDDAFYQLDAYEEPDEYGIATLSFEGKPNDYSEITHNTRYNSYTVRKGIDVSKYQSSIDWRSVRNSGIEFAIIRLGNRGLDSGSMNDDPYGIQNLQAARAAGMKVGVYFFSQATTQAEAIEEANYMLRAVNGVALDLPIVMDYEYGDGNSGRLYAAHLSKQDATNNVLAFCGQVKSAGYVPMLYANGSFLNSSVYADQISANYPIWLANYTYETGYQGNYNLWQFSSKGTVPGIEGWVDLDVWYDNGAPLFSHFTGLAQNGTGEFCYYRDNVWAENYTGYVQYIDGQWYYVQNGKVRYDANGLFKHIDGNWYYAKGGVLDWNYTGIAQNPYGDWFAVRNGRYDGSANGLVYLGNGFYYTKNGSVLVNYNGFVQYHDGRWYYVNHGKIDYTANGLFKHIDGGWYYARGGVIDWNYSGLGKNSFGDWYAISNGVYNGRFNGLMEYNNKFFYVRSGSLLWNYDGFCQYTDGKWYYVDHGQINYTCNGLFKHADGNWYYARGGVIDWKYTGLSKNSNGDWCAVKDGKYNTKFIGLMDYNKKFFYVRNGNLRWDYYGFCQYTDGKWYYVNHGQVDYTANGLFKHADGNLYYARGGVIDWKFNGKVKYSDGNEYLVSKGTVKM